MDNWDQEDVDDLVGPGFIELELDHMGRLGFIADRSASTCERLLATGTQGLSSHGMGFDGGDPLVGRGWACWREIISRGLIGAHE